MAQQYNSRRVKGTMYKGGINVPLVISGNKVTRLDVSDNSLINTTDLFSTISELCGIENSDVFDSKSFTGLFNSNSSSNSRDYIYSELGNNEYAIRNSTHKYIHFEDGTEALLIYRLTNLKDQIYLCKINFHCLIMTVKTKMR